MSKKIPQPTTTCIKQIAARECNKKNTKLDIYALRFLFGAYPKNMNIYNVLLKVVALNVLYSTRIFDVRNAAQVIVSRKIDKLLRGGTPEAVKRIQKMRLGGKVRGTYSFATKYCNSHDPDNYPIYDRNVVKGLTAYRKKDNFAQFTQKALKNYETYKKVLLTFRSFYKLKSVSTTELDKFLWAIGETS